MSEYVYAGLTSQTIDIFLADSSSTTGEGLTGLVYNTSSLTAYYRKGATGSAVTIGLANGSVGGAWVSAGFKEIDSTNMPGIYRLDLPNAAVDTEGFVTVYIQGAADFVSTALRIDCRPLPANVKKINDSSNAAQAMQNLYDSGLEVAVDDATYTPITTAFETNGTVSGDDTLIGMAGTWTNAGGTPANVGLYFITDSEGTTTNSHNKLKLTVETMPNAPADGDTFFILGGRSK